MSNKAKFTADDIEQKVEDYFNYCNENNKPFTMSGLALFLDCSRMTLYQYENELIKFNNISEEDKKRIIEILSDPYYRTLRKPFEDLRKKNKDA